MGCSLHPIGPEIFGGIGEATARALAGELPVARTSTSFESLDGGAGEAWGDGEFLRELRERDERIEAPVAARDQLELLATGAADCVISGQQPGILGGPILLACKVACTIALARELSLLGDRPVVPVYWCGADDSDLAETTHAWLWSMREEPLRIRLDRGEWPENARVGSIDAGRIAALERTALEHADPDRDANWDWPAHLARLAKARDFAEHMAMWVHELFPEDGVVVVDARSASLRALGRPLFARYREDREACTEALLARSRELSGQGLAAQLAEDALASGFFRLEGEQRVKLAAAEIDAADLDALAPSVLLRPLWQDLLLGPRAAVLGPAELAYHAQIAPLYERLGVRAAAALPRAQLHCLPAALVERVPDDLQALLGSEETRARWLRERALSESESRALRQLARDWRAALERFEAGVPELDAAVRAEQAQRLGAQLERLRDAMGPQALRRRGEAWRHVEAWTQLRGVPQERSHTLASLCLRFGRDDAAACFGRLGAAWIEALRERRAPHFAALLGKGGA